MKRILFLLLFLLSVSLFAASCGGAEVSSSEDETTLGIAFSTAKETTEEMTTAIPEEDTTYPDIPYDTDPIAGEVGEPLAIHWNPYLLSPILSQNDELKSGAEAMIKAILNRRLTVTFSSADVMQAVCDNLFYEFPPSALCSFSLDEETLTVTIRYRLARQEHLDAIAEFGAVVENTVKESLSYGDSEAVRALLLYHAVSSSVDYFHVDYEAWQTNAYYALIGKKSICYGFSDAYNYLLRQVGIEAYLAKSYRPSDRADHGWSVVKIDGVYYHCDTTWESSAYDGAGFMYFGYTDGQRASAIAVKDATVGEGSLEVKLPVTANSQRFSEINGDCIRNNTWSMDKERQVILVNKREYSFGNK